MKNKFLLIAMAIMTIALFAACNQPDEKVSVASVTLNKTSLTMTVGGEETLIATIAPSNATNQNVEWSSNAPSVVEVANGKVTAKTAGSGTITVKTQDGGKTATCSVTVTGAAATVATPTANIPEGTYTTAQSITLTTATAGATIRYTTDGTTPTNASAAYTSAISISTTTTLKAIAVKEGMNNSATLTATYTITTTATPSADAGQDFTHDIIKDGASITLNGTAQNGTIAWTCTPPASSKQPAISDTATAQPILSGFDKLGEYTFTLTVTNGTESKSDTVKVMLVATVPAVVSFVPLTASYPTSTIDFSPSTALPTSITYKLADNKSHSWELGKDGFNGQITVSGNYNSSGYVTFTQTFYLDGTKITGASERVVVVYLGNFDGIKFAEGVFNSDTGLVTLNEIIINEGSIPPVVVSFVQLGTFPGATTLNFSPITALPKGVTYIITNDKTSKTWNNIGTVSASDFVNVNDDITFTQTFYLNGTEITGAGSKRTVKLNVDTFMGVTDFYLMNDTGSVTLSITE